MPDLWMDVDTNLAEVPVNILPLLDATDFKSIEAAVAYDAAGLALYWHFVTTAGAYSVTAVTPTTGGNYDWTDQGDAGIYTIEIPASGGASINNDTEGFGWFTGVATGVLPWRGPTIGFRRAALNDLFIDGSTASTNLEDFFDGTGYAGGTAKLTVDLTKILGTALTETSAGYLAAAFKKLLDVATPVLTAASVNQTGDAYAAIGTPVALDSGTATIAGMLTKLADDNGGATFDAGTDSLNKISDAIPAAAPTAGDVADAVLDEAKGAHTGFLTTLALEAGGNLAAVLEDTGTDIPATLTTIDGNVSAILEDTGTTLPATLALMPAAVDQLLSTTHGSGYWDGTTNTVGAYAFTYTLTDTSTGNPIPDVTVWATTDLDGTNVVQKGITDDFGVWTCYLQAGTYYIWRRKAGWTFSNPDTELVAG